MYEDNQTTIQNDNTTIGDGLASMASAPQSPPVFGADPLIPTPSSDAHLPDQMPTVAPDAPNPEPTVSSADSSTPDSEATSPEPTQPAFNVEPSGDDDLNALKKEAIAKLGPLVDKLDQSPIDKFKTTMMMIQATDDKTLVSKAYEAANAIEDEKLKAQALLDVVNEINYFTSPKE